MNPVVWVDPLGLAGDYTPRNGADRAADFSESWPTANLDDAIAKFSGDTPNVFTTSKGEKIFENPNNGVQVVQDLNGNYFRVYDPNLPGKRKYMDMDGNVPNNKTLSNGKQTGLSQAEYNQTTHFNIE